MANNIPITPGTGAGSVATETVAGVSYQQIQVYGQGGASVLGINPDGSLRASIIGVPNVNVGGGSIVAIPTGNQSISGAINISGSVMLGSSNGSIIAFFQNSSILAVPVGSVIAVIPGSIVAVVQSSSILSVPVGSIITVAQGSVSTIVSGGSIAGTQIEDAAHVSGDKGILGLNVRNDAMSSMTSADGDYGALALGPAGEGIVANAPLTKWVGGTTSIMYGASVAVVAAQGASIFTYVTSGQVVNMSANQSLITFQGASGSVVGYTTAPANGGSNFTIPNAWKSNANGAITASISGVSSVYISLQGFIAKI